MLAIESGLSTVPAKQAQVAKTLYDSMVFFFSYSGRHNHIKPKHKYMAHIDPLQAK